MLRTHTIILGSGLAAAGFLLVSCGGGGSGGGASTAAPVTSTGGPVVVPPTPSAGAPVLASARWRDLDASRSVTPADEVLLTFDRAVRLRSPDPARDLALVAGDTLGVGASAAPGPQPDTVAVVLGQAPVLSLWKTWLPGQPPGPGKTPASIVLAVGRAPDAFASITDDPAADGRPVAIIAADPDAAPFDEGRSFTDPPLAAARAVYGSLHSHTGFSDGELDPQLAHQHVKGLPPGHGMDFMATSDHLEQITTPHWTTTQQMADTEQVAGSYIALVGFEWGHGYIPPLGWYNHMNIVGTTHRVGLAATINPTGFYQETLRDCFPEGAIGIFNHPYIHKPPLVYDQWDDFFHDEAADKLMSLIDCEGNGSAQTPELGFLPALAHGWRVAPSSNQDNHQANWGDKNENRTGVWLVDLDRPSILRAIREGRAFSTGDRNARVRLIANAKLWMGSTISVPGPVALRIEADDADGEAFARIELWSNGHVVATQPTPQPGPIVFETTVDPTVDTDYFARIYQADGDELFSAPIYVDR